MKNNEIKLAIVLVVIGVLTRTIFHLGENIEFITAIAIATSFLFKNKKLAMLSVLASLIISDLIIGNRLIFLFTWSGFVFTYLFGLLSSKLLSNRSFGVNLISSTSLGVISTIVFFLWTNFGVVLTSSLYEKTFNGLILSYINGLPFLKNQMFGNLVIVPVMFVAIYFILKYNENLFSKFTLKDRE